MKKYILLIAISIISLASVNWVSAQTATNEWDACKDRGDVKFKNGDACSYTKTENSSTGPVTKTESGYCDRAGGLSGGTFYCATGTKINGWKDCFFLGDACEINGKVGVCSGNTNGSKGTCDTTKTPPGNPGGSTPATCGGTSCPSPKVCATINGSPRCVDSAKTSDDKCAGQPCEKVCTTINGSPRCVDDASTPGTPADNGTTPDASSPQTVGFINPSRFNSITELIAGIINALLGILGAITVAVLVASGFKYMTSSNPGEVGQALEGIRNAIVGLMIIMGAFLITQYVITALAG
jgi:hypothetical protein